MEVIDLISLISFVPEIIRSHTLYLPTKPSLVLSTKRCANANTKLHWHILGQPPHHEDEMISSHEIMTREQRIDKVNIPISDMSLDSNPSPGQEGTTSNAALPGLF